MNPDIDALVKALDLPAKVRLLTGAETFTLHGDEEIGLHPMNFSDGPNGVRGLKFSGGDAVALLPNGTLLASAWSEEATHETGRILAEEALRQRIHVVLGPTVNLHRTALGGRLFEAFSEDPLLTGKLAAAYVRGLQELGVGASVKHLVANESETERNTVDSVVDEATLRELYLLPFEIAVAEGRAWTLMAAYNDVNGVAATEQTHVNTEIVKGEWGYDGLIMSDWFATKTTAASANGGLDLVMPGPGGPWEDALVAAVRAGEVAESVIDDHLVRLLRLADRTGALGTARSYPAAVPPDSPVRREQLTRLAAQGMTVLKNVDAVLPLPPTGTVALIGRHAVETVGMGGGSARVTPPYQVSVAAGLAERLGATHVTVTDGVEVRTRPVPARDGFLIDPHTGAPGVHAVLLDRTGKVLDERSEASAVTTAGFDDGFAGIVASVRLEGRITRGGAVALGASGAGDWVLRVGGKELEYALHLTGSGMGEELLNPPLRTDVLQVEAGTDFSATVTVPRRDPGGALTGIGRYGLLAASAPRPVDGVLAAASQAAAAADVAVVVVGLTDEQETEAIDKHTLALPGEQDALVEVVAGAARRTVVVINAATPVLMPWLEHVDAVVWAGLPGQEAGHAVAAALMGDIEPAGRLVTTFPAADEASPAWSVTPVDGHLPYDEGTFIGHRGHFAGLAPEPRFWFGEGLGYSTWSYSDAVRTGSSVEVTVTNTGSRPSREVVQLYFRPSEPDQPVRLVGWATVSLDAGASAPVTVTADPRLLRRWTTTGWAPLADGGQFLIARGLGDIRTSCS